VVKQRLTHRHGFTLLEVIIVVTILGVLLTIGITQLPRDRFAVNQAAEGLARDVQLTRFEAIRRNEFVVLRFDVAANGYQLIERDSGTVIKRVTFGDAATPQVRLASVTPSGDVLFDPRGITRSNQEVQVLFSSRTSDFTRAVLISQQGRAVIQ
jgi:type IV fimbrial biogenesis protein FimT